MVAERSVNLWRIMETYFGKIRSDNVGMSNEKQCEKHCRLKFKVFKGRLILLDSKSVSKKQTKVFIDE